MAEEVLSEIVRRLGQIDYIVVCVMKDIEAGDTESAAIGLSVVIDYLEELKKTAVIRLK